MRSPAATLVNLIVIIHAFLSCGLTVFSVIAPYWYDLWPELGNGGLFVYCFEDECKTLSGKNTTDLLFAIKMVVIARGQ